MKTISTLLFAFVLQLSLVQSQAILVSNFDENPEDWTVEGGAIYYLPQNGNSGGFIEFEDNQDGAGVFLAPARFLGDIKAYNLGTIEFDLKNTYSNGQNLLYGYGNLTISSPAATASYNAVPLNLLSDWTLFTIPLNAESWSMTPTGWDSLMSDVTRISIQMDAEWDYYDKTGLDNFSIKPAANAVESGKADSNSSMILYQNYPNPAIDVSSIVIELTKSKEEISLILTKADGSLLKSVFHGSLSPGKHTFTLDTGNLPKGLYLIRLFNQSKSLTRKIVIN